MTNHYVPAQGRVTPHMQEQDPRRDVLGAIGRFKRTLRYPEKEPQSIHRASMLDYTNHRLDCDPIKERADHETNRKNAT